MKFGVVVFPGSNCEKDAFDAVTQYLGQPAVYIWHEERDLQGVDALILPGGFTYGDYLRTGAIARFAPVMESVRAFAEQGRPVLGICNGFQILTESGLLPGALTRNRSLQFLCDQAQLVVENTQTPFTHTYQPGQVITIPVAHAEGSYMAEPDVVSRLEDTHRVVFRYASDINGSVNRIAGIVNERGNVLGMMPHPERNLWPGEAWTGDGRGVFDALLKSAVEAVA